MSPDAVRHRHAWKIQVSPDDTDSALQTSWQPQNESCGVFQVDMNFMKKIPPGAEASNVLVGEVDFLDRPIIAFIRLAPAVLLTGLTEVPVPTR